MYAVISLSYSSLQATRIIDAKQCSFVVLCLLIIYKK